MVEGLMWVTCSFLRIVVLTHGDGDACLVCMYIIYVFVLQSFNPLLSDQRPSVVIAYANAPVADPIRVVHGTSRHQDQTKAVRDQETLGEGRCRRHRVETNGSQVRRRP